MNLEKEIFDISLVDIMPNRFQPREIFDDEALHELSKSIQEHGVIQPIIVRKVGDKYEIIAGERRFRASQLAGKETIPALVRDIDDKEAAKIALLENLQRKDLTPIEEAKTYQTILKLDNITQEELAQSLGKSQSAIANKLRLLNLDEEVQTALLNSQISERHARSLLSLDNQKQKELLVKILNNRLTVRQVDEEIMRMTGQVPEVSESMNEVNDYMNAEGPTTANFNNVQNIVTEPIVNANEMFNNNFGMNNMDIPNTIMSEQPNIMGQTAFEMPVQEKQAFANPIETIIPNESAVAENINSQQANIVSEGINAQSTNIMPENTADVMPKSNIFDSLRIDMQASNPVQNEETEVPEIIPQSTVINSEIQEPTNNNYNNIYDLRFAINNFRQAIQNTEKFGFKVKAEEFDNPDSYQIVIKIEKNS